MSDAVTRSRAAGGVALVLGCGVIVPSPALAAPVGAADAAATGEAVVERSAAADPASTDSEPAAVNPDVAGETSTNDTAAADTTDAVSTAGTLAPARASSVTRAPTPEKITSSTREPAAATKPAPPVELPDLGTIRYRDPTTRRTLWLGVDAGGVYLPASLGVFRRTVWTAHTAAAWALALTPWLAAGGRHALVWYDATNIRLRMHHHEVELSGRPTAVLGTSRMYDRLALGVEFHTLRKSVIEGESFFLGGIKDVVVRLGYGIEHVLHPRWRLGWNVQGRYASVFINTQRHLRASARVTFLPRPQHGLALEAVAFMVHRDPDQFGTPFPRLTGHGQFALQYDWLSRHGVGLMVRARYTTGFLSGEAPVYELREESLGASYGELVFGVRAVWR